MNIIDVLIFLPIIVLTVYQMRARSMPALRINFYICGSMVIFLLSCSVGNFLAMLNQATPYVYDPVLYRVEALTDLVQAAPIAFFFMLDLHCGWLISAVYDSPSLLVVIAASSEIIFSPWSLKDNLISRFIAAILIGYSLYMLMPAVGPFPFLGLNFTHNLPLSSALPPHPVLFPHTDIGDSRNAMPSLHATWSILCLLALRHSPPWHKALGAIYVLVTFITTLGVGLHYLVDWVAALPLILLVRGLTVALPLRGIRGKSIAAGICLLILWVVVVRGAPQSLAFPLLIKWIVAVSLAAPPWLEWQLRRAEDRFRRKATHSEATGIFRLGNEVA